MINNHNTLTEDFNEFSLNRMNELSYSSKSKVSTNFNSPVTNSPEFSSFLNAIVKNCYELEECQKEPINTEEKKRVLISKFLPRNWKENYKIKRETLLRQFYGNLSTNCNTSFFEVKSNFTKANVNVYNLNGNHLPQNMNCNNLNLDPQKTSNTSTFSLI
jgi:hypothetical protein